MQTDVDSKSNTSMALLDLSFSKVMQLLSATRDEEKFVGLYLLTKTIKNDDIDHIRQAHEVLFNNDDNNEKLNNNSHHQAVGFKFLQRLLHSEEYWPMAINLISCFCVDKSFCLNNELLNNMNDIVELLKRPTITLDTITDIFNFINLILNQSKHTALVMLINHTIQCINTCIDTLLKFNGNNNNNGNTDNDNITTNTTIIQAFTLFHQFMQIAQLYEMQLPSCFNEVIQIRFPLVIELLYASKDIKKFQLLEFIADVCNSNAVRFPDPSNINDNTKSMIRFVLFDILRNKISTPYRIQLFTISDTLLHQWGLEWAIPSNNNTTLNDQSHKYLLLLYRLVAIEVELMLDHRANRDNQQTKLLYCCFSLIETLIGYLVLQDEPYSMISLDKLIEFKSIFNNIFLSVICYLEDKAGQNPSNNKDESFIQLATIRLLGLWLKEESNFPSGVFNIMPHLLQITPPTNDILMQPLTFLLPSFCEILHDEKMRTIFIENKGTIKVVEYLQKHTEELLIHNMEIYPDVNNMDLMECAWKILEITNQQSPLPLNTSSISLFDIFDKITTANAKLSHCTLQALMTIVSIIHSSLLSSRLILLQVPQLTLFLNNAPPIFRQLSNQLQISTDVIANFDNTMKDIIRQLPELVAS